LIVILLALVRRVPVVWAFARYHKKSPAFRDRVWSAKRHGLLQKVIDGSLAVEEKSKG